MKTSDAPLWAQPGFRQIAGDTWRPGGTRLTRHGLGLCGFARGARVLDVGCGAGATLAILRDCGCYAVGLDSSMTGNMTSGIMNGMAGPPAPGTSTGHGVGPSPRICADAAQMPFASASFDGIVMECALSLMARPGDVLQQCARILRGGGRLLLTDLFARASTPPQAPKTLGQMGQARQAGQSCHERALPRQEMERLFAQAGLTLRIFEDHTTHLRELAARLVWHGQASREDFCTCGAGYGLWLLEKGEKA